MKALGLLLALALAGCIHPTIEVCSKPGACVLNTCTTDNACNAKPLELRP